MKTFKWQEVGRLIAWGGEHVVRHYGENQIIKFSLFDRFLWKRYSRVKAEYDLRLANEIFGPYILRTELVVSEDGLRYGKLQPRIEGKKLKRADCKDVRIREQLVEIQQRRHGLVAQDIDIDLVGGMGFITGTFSNIFVLSDGTLRIIDSLLISIPWHSPLAWASRFICRVVMLRQDVLFSEYLGPYERKTL